MGPWVCAARHQEEVGPQRSSSRSRVAPVRGKQCAPRASQRAAPETPVDTGDREATIADAIAAPAMATKLTPGVALNPTGAEPHVEADGKAPRRRARNRDGGRGNGGCALSAGGCGGLGTAPLQRVAEALLP